MASAKIISPQTFNRYVYVSNNPLNLIDPSGLCGTTPGSTDGTPCIWIVKDGIHKSVSEKEFGDGDYGDWTRVENPDSVVLNDPEFEGKYAEVEIYKAYQKNKTSVGLGSNGMFYGIDNSVEIGNVEELLVGSDELSLKLKLLFKLEKLIGQDILPDSVEGSAGFLGLGGNVTYTRDGDVLGGGNANLADTVANPVKAKDLLKGGTPLPGGSIMFNKILRPGRIDRKTRRNIESGASFGIGGGSIIGGQIMYVPSTGDVVLGLGFTTPGVYFGGSYQEPINTSLTPDGKFPINW